MALNIKYSPDFTGECYQSLPSGKSLMGSTVVSDSGLLELMELRLGLPSVSVPEKCRAIEYRRALKLHKAGAFFESSFDIDSLGVAQQMLRWRDSLKMAGWNSADEWESERLKVLSIVESDFNSASFPGEVDRWLAVIKEQDACKVFSQKDTIEVWYPEKLLPFLIGKAVGLSCATVKYMRDSLSKDISKEKIEILSFTELSDAYEYFAEKGVEDGTVVINKDSLRFNSVLFRRNLPEISASADNCSPAVTQLFKLGLSLIVRPLNVYNLLAFLQVPLNPLPDYIRVRLASALLKDNGLGEKWEETLEGYAADREQAKKDDPVKRYLLSLLDEDCREGNVPKNVVEQWCKDMKAWAEKQMVRREATPKQEQTNAALQSLAASCTAMLQLLSSESGEIGLQDYLHIVGSIWSSTAIRVSSAQLGSLDTIGSPHRILHDGAKVLWLDCNGELDINYPYDFLIAEEQQELEGRTMIPEKKVLYSYAFSMLRHLLSTAEKVTLVRSQYDCGSPLEEHPAVTLAKRLGVAETEIEPREWTGQKDSITKKASFDMGGDVIGKFQRIESPSSIENLIENPDDYYLHYMLKLQDLSATTFSDPMPTRGTVAHMVFETMMKDSGKDISAMRSMTEEGEFHRRVVDAAFKKGPTLLQGGNEVDFADFVETLRDSITVLLNILEKNNLTPWASEYKIGDKEKGVDVGLTDPIRGSVDFIAKDAGGNFVIIDFKYPGNKGTFYADKLKNDNSVQLELYSKAVSKMNGGTPVAATAYYLFPIKELHTCSGGTFARGDGVVIETAKSVTPSLFDRIKDGIDTRRKQMAGGTVEIPKPNERFAYGKQVAKYEVLKNYTK